MTGAQSGQVRRVGLVTDHGMPATLGTRLAGTLPEVLAHQLSADLDWRLSARTEALRLDEHGQIPLLDLAEGYNQREDWDLVIFITDLPRRAGTLPLLADYSSTGCVGLVSLPALGGGFRLRSRLADVLVHLIGHLTDHAPGLDPHDRDHTSPARAARRVRTLLSPTRHIPSSQDGIDEHLALIGLRGRARLLRGMIHDNQPWRLVPHLASATAAAAATAAFGIFYSSIWTMADALAPWRLALITVLAILAMVTWLITYNHLWDRPAGHRRPGHAVLYNVSTVLTLLISVSCMYAMLYILALGAAATVIAAGYLHAKLGHPVGPGDYATLVWLSCSMGIVAGALGSSLDSEQAVRQATYSRRERERQARNRARAHHSEQHPDNSS